MFRIDLAGTTFKKYWVNLSTTCKATEKIFDVTIGVNHLIPEEKYADCLMRFLNVDKFIKEDNNTLKT